MSGVDEANETGQRVLDAIRGVLSSDYKALTSLAAEPTHMSQYISVILAASAVRLVSLATGITESAIVDELATNYPKAEGFRTN